jgi:hypothetical protein
MMMVGADLLPFNSTLTQETPYAGVPTECRPAEAFP